MLDSQYTKRLVKLFEETGGFCNWSLSSLSSVDGYGLKTVERQKQSQSASGSTGLKRQKKERERESNISENQSL